MAQLVQSDVPQVAERMGEDGGISLLCDMLHNSSSDVLSVACTALAGVCDKGTDLDVFGGTESVIQRLGDILTEKTLGQSQQVRCGSE